MHPNQSHRRAKLYQTKYGSVFTPSATSGKMVMCCLCQSVLKCDDGSKFLQHIVSIHSEKLWWIELECIEKLTSAQNDIWDNAKKKRLDGVAYASMKPSNKRPVNTIASMLSKKSKPDIAIDVVKGLIMGDFAISAVDSNPGLRHIIESFNGTIPAGLSATSNWRAVDKLYDEEVNELQDELAQHTDHLRSVCIQHDGWTSQQQEGLLGTTLSYVDTKTSPWKLKFERLGMVPSDADHSAVHSRSIVTAQLNLAGLTWQDVLAGTSDTTGASINVVKDCKDDLLIGADCTTAYIDENDEEKMFCVETIYCAAHTANLWLLHSVKGERYIGSNFVKYNNWCQHQCH